MLKLKPRVANYLQQFSRKNNLAPALIEESQQLTTETAAAPETLWWAQVTSF